MRPPHYYDHIFFKPYGGLLNEVFLHFIVPFCEKVCVLNEKAQINVLLVVFHKCSRKENSSLKKSLNTCHKHVNIVKCEYIDSNNSSLCLLD